MVIFQQKKSIDVVYPTRAASVEKYSRRYRGNFAAKVKKFLLKTVETKSYDIADESVLLYHNLGLNTGVPPAIAIDPCALSFAFNPWTVIAKGTKK